MKFAATIVAVAVGVAPLGASAFSTAFSRGVVKSGISRSVSINKRTHSSGCKCFTCSGGFALRMSDTAVEEEAVPAEVVAMDGIASEEEAHNVDRPARGSGIHKHNKDGGSRVELKDLEIGAEVTAKVKTVTSYGAFLDIGAKSDALIHVSRLSDDFVANVEDGVKQGEEIQVRIISVDTDKNQIAVTMRSAEAEAKAAEGQSSGRPSRRRERPQRSGADSAAQAASINALGEKGFDDEKFVEGEVVSSLDFGAFVRFDTAQLGEGLEGEVDGLVHISALAEGRTGSVSDVVAIGDKVQVRVRSVDTGAGRISLSMITKEQEEASRPAPRERKEGGRGGGNVSPVANNFKDMGAADWKETLGEFAKEQPGFTNTAVVVDRRK
jgi:predicted RNA-binding protein with RPS1 domain